MGIIIIDYHIINNLYLLLNFNNINGDNNKRIYIIQQKLGFVLTIYNTHK